MTDIRNPATWPSLAEPDPEYKAAIDAMGGSAPDLAAFPSIHAMRKFLEDAKTFAKDSYGQVPGVKEEDRMVTMRDGHQIAVRIHSPESKPADGSPLAVVFHGGGWCIGGLVNEELLCRLMANRFGVTSVNVDYRLGPEHNFPMGQLDGFDATKWAAENASSLGADPSKGFIVCGTSAGGNIACVVSHLWGENNMSPPLTGSHLMVPALCVPDFFPEELKKDWKSWDQLEHAAILSHKAHAMFLNNYIPNHADRSDPRFSPLLFSSHKNLPPQSFQICGMDPLRDESLIFERLLREQEGVKTKLQMYPGVPHGFWSVFPKMKLSQNFIQESLDGIKWLLEQK